MKNPLAQLLKRSASAAWIRDFPQWSGVLVGLCGLLMVVSWHAHWRPVLQMVPNTAPMQYNTALCFILAGLALFLLTTSRLRIAQLAGGLVGLVGAITLMEYLSGGGFGLDQFFFTPYFTAASTYPGRMSPLAAGCFVLIGSVLVQLGANQRGRWLTSAGLMACIVAVIAFVALLGYAFDTDAAYGWGAYSRMAVNTAGIFLLLGAGSLVLASRLATAENRSFVRWLPVASSVTLILMIAFVAAMNRVDLEKATFWRKHTFEVILNGRSVEQNLAGIQRNLRTYAATGDPGALAAHQAAIPLESQLVARLIELTADNPAQQLRLSQLDAAERAVLDYDRGALDAYRQGGYAAFSKLDATGPGRALTTRTRELLMAFSDEEQRLLDLRDASEQKNSRNAERLLIFSSLVAAGLLVGANYLAAREMARRQRGEAERERLIGELQQALVEVKTLSGLIPICGWCKSIRTDQGYWQTVEQYVCTHTEATFTHGICPPCAEKWKAEIASGSRPPIPVART